MGKALDYLAFDVVDEKLEAGINAVIEELETLIDVRATHGISYDRFGRMQYHPDFHPNHRKLFTEEELEYLCKFYEIDNTRSLAFAIGKTEATLRDKVNLLRKSGEYEQYKKRWDSRYEHEARCIG